MLDTKADALRQEIPPPTDKPDLADLARTACEAHAATGREIGEAVRHAITGGRALIAARKRLIEDGQWTVWVNRNCNFTIRHAQRYIKLVEAYDADATRVSRDVLGLSLRGALKRLTTTKTAANSRKSKGAVKNGWRTTGLDIAEAWDTAPLEERTRAINNIGLKPLLQALPENWIPSIEKWLAERRLSIELPTTPLAVDDPDPIPSADEPRAPKRKKPEALRPQSFPSDDGATRGGARFDQADSQLKEHDDGL
jgi:hypothetical protein